MCTVLRLTTSLGPTLFDDQRIARMLRGSLQDFLTFRNRPEFLF